jgi:hypothetical protein
MRPPQQAYIRRMDTDRIDTAPYRDDRSDRLPA